MYCCFCAGKNLFSKVIFFQCVAITVI